MPIKSTAKKLDRRVVRTRQLLRDALLALILENGYDGVTVQDITDRANLGRATFYLHYKDKDELLIKSLQVVFDELESRMDIASADLANSPPMLAFRHAGENGAMYRIILSGQAGHKLFQRTRDYISQQIKRNFLTLFPIQTDLPEDLLANYMAGSLLSLITWWLEAEMPYSAEYMADTYNRLIMPGILLEAGITDGPWTNPQ